MIPLSSVTRKLLDTLELRLQDKDYQIIHEIGRFKLMTATQIQRLFFDDFDEKYRPRRTQDVLKRLTERDKILARVGERAIGTNRRGSAPNVFTLALTGQHLAQLSSSAPRRPYVDYKPSQPHYLAVAETYVLLKEAERAGRLKVLEHQAEPYCWRPLGDTSLKPDGYVKIGIVVGGLRRSAAYFLEIDRGEMWGTKIATKIPAYEKYFVSVTNSPRVMFSRRTNAELTT